MPVTGHRLKKRVAEGEGFEPPIPVRVCMISSHVHSTGLCHPSVGCCSGLRYMLLQLADYYNEIGAFSQEQIIVLRICGDIKGGEG